MIFIPGSDIQKIRLIEDFSLNGMLYDLHLLIHLGTEFEQADLEDPRKKNRKL